MNMKISNMNKKFLAFAAMLLTLGASAPSVQAGEVRCSVTGGRNLQCQDESVNKGNDRYQNSYDNRNDYRYDSRNNARYNDPTDNYNYSNYDYNDRNYNFYRDRNDSGVDLYNFGTNYNYGNNYNNNYNSLDWSNRNNLANLVNQIFFDILGRNADANRLRTYTNTYSRGQSFTPLRRELANSSEAREAINRLYRQVLGRNADRKGLDTYTKSLRNGWSLAQIRRDLANSQEARNRRY